MLSCGYRSFGWQTRVVENAVEFRELLFQEVEVLMAPREMVTYTGYSHRLIQIDVYLATIQRGLSSSGIDA